MRAALPGLAQAGFEGVPAGDAGERVVGGEPFEFGARGGQPRVQDTVLDQQQQQNEARPHQPENASGVEAEVVASAVEHGTERDIADPDAQHHHQPDIEGEMRLAAPQHGQGHHAKAPCRAGHHPHDRRIAIRHHDRGQPVLARRGQCDACARRAQHGGDDEHGCPPLERAGGEAVRFPVFPHFEHGIGHHEQRKARMPEHVDPGRALRPRTEQAPGCKQPGERQQVPDRGGCREQVAARQRQHGARTRDGELAEQQGGGHQVIENERRFVGRDERRKLRQPHLGKRHHRDEDQQGHQGNGPRHAIGPASRGQAQQ
ncbi:hypothetical protein GO296_04653 [Ralstonia solanacearum]|nr:hypothetical protein [Ralstonia solanacearum]NKF56590.1 hypothetical protein [Ralstonia solanacearum]NKF62417.1 hypothetical protein [Ralstonia solanacearum]NKF67376.1 hypothetical protein [Ralstonia solanacearum]NKF72361.1 hypothetical protein [Ralstonia solanacearum]